MLTTQIIWFGKTCLSVCDRKCEKAWGVNGRCHGETSSIKFDDDDDIVFLADDEVGMAPHDPGTYEGGQAKPLYPQVHNKWCVRECERCSIIEVGEEIVYPDYSVRHYNTPWKHPEASKETNIRTGKIFQPR